MRLPDTAWVRTTAESREQARRDAAWTTGDELAAQHLEMLSILASERRLRKPLEVPRPDWVRGRGSSGGVARAVAVLKANAIGRTRVHRPGQGAT